VPVTRAVEKIEENIFASKRFGKDVASVVTSWGRKLALVSIPSAVGKLHKQVHHDKDKGVNTTGHGTAVAAIYKDEKGKYTMLHDDKWSKWDEANQKWV
jgi:hypothetical protein